MATTPVLGNGPFEYTDPSTGKQVSIPLNALNFSSGQLSINSGSWPASVPAFVTAILSNLAQQGLIVPMPTPAPKAALVITATDPGTSGNGIKVTATVTTPNADPTQTVFSLKVEETDSYPGLTIKTITQVLGTDKKASTNPGLVHVVDGTLAASGVPAKVSKQALTLPASPPPSASAQTVINDGSKSAWVTLEAKKPGQDGTLTTVSIDNVDTKAGTFDLTACWVKTVTGITLLNLKTTLAGLAYDVGASAPQSGIYSVPAGMVHLTGGAPGTPASAVLFSA